MGYWLNNMGDYLEVMRVRKWGTFTELEKAV